MNFYEEYKPFRNYMRRFELVPGLVDVWCYSLHVMEVSPYEAAYMDNGTEPSDVIFELHRIAHRQFPWQISVGMAPMMRAFKVFGEAEVDAIVARELGMTVRQFLLLGVAVGGSFLKKWGMSTNQDYGVLGISSG